MKKSAIALLIGAGTMMIAASSFGQGQVSFQNYDFGAAGLNAPVTFGYTGTEGGGIHGIAGERVGSEFQADLLYSLDGGATFSLLTAAQSGNPQYPTHFAFGVGADGDAANFAGYFFGNPVTIPGYTSGSISFYVEAWTGGANYFSPTSVWHGRSVVFTMPSIATGTTQPGNFSGLNGFVVGVPEPTVFALAGVGGAALMIVRRKK